MLGHGLMHCLRVLLLIALVVTMATADSQAAGETQAESSLQAIEIDVGQHGTYWEDDEVIIRVAGLGQDIQPQIALLLTDKQGNNVERLYKGLLPAEGLSRSILARDLPPGSYRLRLHVKSNGAQRTVEKKLIIVPHRDYRTFVATGAIVAPLEFTEGQTQDEIPQCRGFPEANMNLVHYASRRQDPQRARQELDDVAFADVLAYFRITSGGFGEGYPIDSEGERTAGGFFNNCFNNPLNRQAGRQAITEHCQALQRHPALLGYTIQDEIQHSAQACYCQYCQDAFRKWLGQKYRTIDELNQVWGTDYGDFSQVQAPLPLTTRGEPTLNEGVNRYAWYDWLNFKDWSMADYIREFTELIHKLDPGKVVGNHLIPDYFSSQGYHWRSNPFVLQPVVDQSVTSIWGGRYTQGFLANVESHIKKPAWGTGTNPFVGPDRRFAQLYSGYMHGFQGVIFFCYRPDVEGGIDFGLLEWEPRGKRGAKYFRFAAVNQRVRQIAPVLGELPTVRAPVGLLWSDATAIQNPEDNRPEADFFGLYKALNRLQLEPVILYDAQLTAEQLKPLKAVVLAGCWDLLPEVADLLREYVRAGGYLIASTNTGYYDHGHKETHALADLFGAQQSNYTQAAEQLELKLYGEANAPAADMAFLDQTVPIIGYIQGVTLKGARVLARSEADGKPLLMWNDFGGGSAVLASFTLGKTCAQNGTDVGLAMLEQLLADAGIQRRIQVSSGPQWALAREPEVDAVLRHNEGDQVWYLLAVNYGETGRKEYQIAGRFPYVYDIFGHQPVSATVKGNRTTFAVEQVQYEPQAYALVADGDADGSLRYSYQHSSDHFLVKVECASGTLARLVSQGARGRKGKEVFGILSGNGEIQVPIYRIQRKPVGLVVENYLGEAVAVP